MKSGISKKVIFLSFLLINFIQTGKSADLQKINNRKKNLDFQKGFSKILNNKKSSYLTFNNKVEKFLENYAEQLQANLSNKQKELVIQADKQSERNDVIYAEGKVTVSYKWKVLSNSTKIKINSL